MAEYDRLCTCGHRRRQHVHGLDDDGAFLMNGGKCTSAGCTCKRFVLSPDQPQRTLCMNCGTREATLSWVGEGGALAYVHGMHAPWCKHCAVTAQLEYARKLAAQIPELEKELEGLP